MSGATKFIEKLSQDYGLTLFIAVHMGKDKSRGARGHSLIAGWRDTTFTLKRDGTGLRVDVDPRWGKPPEPLKLTFQSGTLWEGDGPGWTKQEEKIRALLLANNCQLTREQVGFGLGLEGSALRNALKRAKDNGAIDHDDKIVRLPATLSQPASPIPPLIEGGDFCDGHGENQLVRFCDASKPACLLAISMLVTNVTNDIRQSVTISECDGCDGLRRKVLKPLHKNDFPRPPGNANAVLVF